jgi:hypothetical protein
MNNFNNQWQNNWNSGYQPQFTTNIIYVTSAEEALMRTTQRNSEAVYFNQDKPIFYRVRVDNDGRKAYQEFPYSQPNPEASMPVSMADFKSLAERLAKLEAILQQPKEVNDGQPNG